MGSIEVPIGDYKTTNGDEILFTTGLEGCVGVAIFQKSKVLTRGLAHIYFGGGVNDLEVQSEMAQEQMAEFLGKFPERNRSAIITAVPFEYTEDHTYKNRMLDFLQNYLQEEGVEVKEVDEERIVGNVGEVHSKDLILTPNEAKIIYRNAHGGCGQLSDMKKIKL
ncbi:hypothetical protein HN935_02025 [archaeon]|jgi:hypothetical protein|nr:hypothetical protein [archaeon]